MITVLERPSVAEITVEGNGVLETEDIIENMATADIAEGRFLPALRWRQFSRVYRKFTSRGRYGASVEVTVEDLPRNRVAISLDINEGEESRIRHINIVGNEVFEEEELLGLFELGTKPWYLISAGKTVIQENSFPATWRDLSHSTWTMATSNLPLNPRQFRLRRTERSLHHNQRE